MSVINWKQIWYLAGEGECDDGWPLLFDTKEAAEVYARQLYPDEAPSTRYCRIFSRNVFTIEHIKEWDKGEMK